MADTKENKNNKSSSVEAAPAKKSSTQAYLDIDQIKEGVVILKDGGMRIVLMCSAINFELKSELERNSIIYSYQNFLNSLDFPIQIIIQSRRLDLDNYLATFSERLAQETNELLRTQIQDYMEYISALVQQTNIMQKRFYVVVTHYPEGIKQVGGMAKFFGTKGTVAIGNFKEERKYLFQKVSTVASGLQGTGLRVSQLATQELIELFYSVYNPDQSVTQKLIDASQLEAEIIEKLPEDMNIG